MSDPKYQFKCEGCGETIHVGDVVDGSVLGGHNRTPQRITSISPLQNPAGCFDIQCGDVDSKRPGWCSFYAGPGYNRTFKVMTQGDVDVWFATAKALKPDGVYDLRDNPNDLKEIPFGKVHVKDGVPVFVQRASDTPYHHIDRVLDGAERLLGFDIKLYRVYVRCEQPARTVRKVQVAVRRAPPQV